MLDAQKARPLINSLHEIIGYLHLLEMGILTVRKEDALRGHMRDATGQILAMLGESPRFSLPVLEEAYAVADHS